MTSFARQSAVLGRVLLAASLFLMLVWWRAATCLFVLGGVALLLQSLARVTSHDLPSLGAENETHAAG